MGLCKYFMGRLICASIFWGDQWKEKSFLFSMGRKCFKWIRFDERSLIKQWFVFVNDKISIAFNCFEQQYPHPHEF